MMLLMYICCGCDYYDVSYVVIDGYVDVMVVYVLFIFTRMLDIYGPLWCDSVVEIDSISFHYVFHALMIFILFEDKSFHRKQGTNQCLPAMRSWKI